MKIKNILIFYYLLFKNNICIFHRDAEREYWDESIGRKKEFI